VGGTALKLAIAAFFVGLSAQIGTLADEVLSCVRESAQASELVEVDACVARACAINTEQARAPKDQSEFEKIVRDGIQRAFGRDPSLDSWDKPYVYERIPSRDARAVLYTITSCGPDRLFGTSDDIVLERENESSTIDRDPAAKAERASERKKRLDRDAATRLRETLAGAPNAPKDVPEHDVGAERAARELYGAVTDLARMLEQ
jgi:hypothetical protein